MVKAVTPPRGMRDFLPADKAHRERILAVIRASYRAHGFDEIETPVVEESERLHAGLGGDNEKLAYAVMKRGLTPDDLANATDPLELADLGLRFDLTVPLARFYASHRGELPAVFRAIQLAPVWRAERPQKGRYRQFVQCDIDIIGEAGALAEVELIVATAAALDALGVEGFTVRINDRRILSAMLAALGFAAADHPAVLITLDKFDKVGSDGVIAELTERGYPLTAIGNLAEFLRSERVASTEFGEASITGALPRGVDAAIVAELAALGQAVNETVGRQLVVFDPFLVRGMGYYTGAIFEVTHPALGYSLGGGGRYDGMIGRFLGTEVPATGISLGFERLVELVEFSNAETADAVALLHDDLPPARLAALKAALVARGMRVRLERRPKNLKPLV